MTQFPETRESLLLQVKDPRDRDAWERFERVYRPVIYRLARQRAMQDADAQDLQHVGVMAYHVRENPRHRHCLRSAQMTSTQVSQSMRDPSIRNGLNGLSPAVAKVRSKRD